MQVTEEQLPFDAKQMEQILRTESKFITDLFSVLSLPKRLEDVESEGENEFAPKMKVFSDKPRAKSLTELQQRLHEITDKKKLTYKEKLTKKSLKNRVKKKTKFDKSKTQPKSVQFEKQVKTETEVKVESADSNTKNGTIFSKIDFANSQNKNGKKQEKDPKKLLEKIEKRKEHLAALESQGDVRKVVEIKEKQAWKNALAKAEGTKVKDDPFLLKKSAKRLDQKKRASKKKWDKRLENVEKKKKERQTKRTENIEKRKKEKKTKKLKKAVKKGAVIPGY